ncbi:CD44 antigen [Varanus komodoensis]|uniref:CD44 antigen n=1 Tax=Varanus komodoensis TaxID=61221 RepID=UPI001CF778CE|nr:CD44 antigen [Varanus komodoensis]
MAKFWLCAALGFYLLQLCSAQIGLNISCRYGGVFHVEKNRRYSLTRDEAVELCRALNSTIPTWEQMQRAYNIGLETCRYGYIEDKVVLPRHTPYHLCAANTTGIYILMSNISDRYDTFCFNASEQSDMNCDPVVKLYSVWPNNGSHGMETIEIFNTDGSRFLDGKRVTEQPPVTDDDSSVGSGSANDRITTDPTIIRHGISQYPYPPDDVTRKYHIDDYDPDDKHPEDKHPETTKLDSYEKEENSAEKHRTSEEDKNDNKAHLSTSITAEMSSKEKHHENSTQGQQTPEDLPLWWPSEEHKGVRNTTSRNDESSEENDDEDDDEDDDEQGSGNIIPETGLEWNNSGDMEPQPSNTTAVVSSRDVKHEDSTHDSLVHGLPSGRDNEVTYSTIGTREDVPPGTVPPGDKEHYSTTTAVSSSDDFFKQEDSDQHFPNGTHPGLETEALEPTTKSPSDVLHPEHVPSIETEGTLQEETFHHTGIHLNNELSHYDSKAEAKILMCRILPKHPHISELLFTKHMKSGKVFIPALFIITTTVKPFNESTEHEESHQDQLSGISEERSKKSPTTNRTIHDVLEILTPPSKNEHENESSQTDMETNDEIKHEETTQNPLPDGVSSEWDSEETYPTNTSGKPMLPGIVPQREYEQNNESIYTVVDAAGGTEHEDPSHDILIHGLHPSGSSEERDLANTSRDGVLPGIVSPSESKHKKDLETSKTEVVSGGFNHSEDSTHDTVLHEEHSEWDGEEKYLTNTSEVHLLPGSFHPAESEHEKEPSDTVMGSKDNAISKDEDATHDSIMHEVHHEWGKEDKVLTNGTKDEESLGIVPPTKQNYEEKTIDTVVIHNDHEDSTQQPLPPIHQPGWDTEEKYLSNTSRDGVLMGGNENEHDLLHTDVVYDGTKEDSTPEPVSHWGSEDQYTTKSTADISFPGIVPRRGINKKNKTDHTAVVSRDGAKSTEDPQLHGWSNEDERLVNNTQDYIIPGVFPEMDSGSDRPPSPTIASKSPDSHKNGNRGAVSDNDSPVPGEPPKSQPRRAHIPDWLIVVASLLALSLILGVCIAVNSRRRCGQKKKLVINNGKGGIEEKNMGGLNGEASKSHEMVHLVHNEKQGDHTGPHDEFLAIDETQNQQDVALKSGM